MPSERFDFPNARGEKLSALPEIAEECPVHRALHSEISIRTREAA